MKPVKFRTIRLLLLLLLGLMAACSSDPAKRKQVALEEVARMPHTEVPLSDFGTFELLPIATSAAVAQSPEKVAVANELGQKLDTRLKPLLQDWDTAAPADKRSRTLMIKPTVASMHVVSSGARFFAGAFSGDSFIDLDMALIDKGTGRPIATQRINRSANALTGAWSVGASDKNLLDYIVDITYQYLADNYKH